MKKENERKEYIIKSIRKALLNKNTIKSITYDSSSATTADNDDPSVVFVENFVGRNGNIMYSTNENEIKSHLQYILSKYNNATICCCSNTLTKYFNSIGFNQIEPSTEVKHFDIAIVPCESIIANNATMLVSNGQGHLELPKVIVLFAFTSQSVMTWKDAVNRIKSQYNDNIPEQMVLLDINNKSFEQIYLLLTED